MYRQRHTLQNIFGELAQFIGSMGEKASISAPGEVDRVSRTRFVWLCTTAQDRGVRGCFICILRGWVGDLIRSETWKLFW